MGEPRLGEGDERPGTSHEPALRPSLVERQISFEKVHRGVLCLPGRSVRPTVAKPARSVIDERGIDEGEQFLDCGAVARFARRTQEFREREKCECVSIGVARVIDHVAGGVDREC